MRETTAVCLQCSEASGEVQDIEALLPLLRKSGSVLGRQLVHEPHPETVSLPAYLKVTMIT